MTKGSTASNPKSTTSAKTPVVCTAAWRLGRVVLIAA
jgi:hypothetical protein